MSQLLLRANSLFLGAPAWSVFCSVGRFVVLRPRRPSFRAARPPLFLTSHPMTKYHLQQLVRFLRLLCVGGDDAFLLEGIFRAEVWDFMGEPVSRENEEAVNDLLATRCVSVCVCVCDCDAEFRSCFPVAIFLLPTRMPSRRGNGRRWYYRKRDVGREGRGCLTSTLMAANGSRTKHSRV